MAHPCSEEQYAVLDIGMVIYAVPRVVEPLHNLVLMYTDLLTFKIASDNMFRSSSARFLNNMECHRMVFLCRSTGDLVL